MLPAGKLSSSPSVSCDTADVDYCLSISDLTPIFFDGSDVSFTAPAPAPPKPKVSAMSTHCALCGALLRLRATRVDVPSALINQMNRRTATISALAKQQDSLLSWLHELSGEVKMRVFSELLRSPGVDEEWRCRLREIQ